MKKISVFIALCFLLVACSPKQSGNNIMSGYKGFEKVDHHFVTKDYNSIIDDITSLTQGVYYIGFAECPWCIALVPVLEDVATEQDMNITYLNSRDEKYSKDTEAIERLNTFISSLPAEDQNDGYVPFIISIGHDKVVKTHLGTAPNHDAPNASMTDEEVNYLTLRLKELFTNAK